MFLALPADQQAERLPLKSYTTADGLVRDQVNHIVRDSRGFLWRCTSEGLSRFDGYRFTTYTIADGLPLARPQNRALGKVDGGPLANQQ